MHLNYIFQPPPRPILQIRGQSACFPVSRVFCIGRNYAEHAREMGHDPEREPPFFFMKAADCLTSETSVAYPPQTADLHFEIELVAALRDGGTDIRADQALEHVLGYAVGLDLTRRDLQGDAKKLGRPWDTGKSFAGAAPVSELVLADETGHPGRGAITLDVNGERRQTGDLSQMIWTVAEQIAELSRFFTLLPGDIVFTGTPAGVGAAVRGDRLSGAVEGVGSLTVEIV